MSDDALAKLDSANVAERYEAIRAIRKMGAAGAFAASRLARALRDGGWVDDYEMGDYMMIAEGAAQALEAMGGPAIPVLLDALRDDTIHACPVKCYDQGAYIGDYASREARVSDLARETLRRMMRDTPRLVDLIAELGKTASNDDVALWIKMLAN